MSLHVDLLKLASLLVNREPKKPKQASLRRAVSTAYCGKFHMLIDSASKHFIGVGNGKATHRNVLKRAFQHGTMKQASKAFFSGSPPTVIHPKLRSVTLDDLKYVAEAFVDLMDARHDADYNLGRRFVKSDANKLVERAHEARRRWENVWKTNEGAAYMIALLHLRNFPK